MVVGCWVSIGTHEWHLVSIWPLFPRNRTNYFIGGDSPCDDLIWELFSPLVLIQLYWEQKLWIVKMDQCKDPWLIQSEQSVSLRKQCNIFVMDTAQQHFFFIKIFYQSVLCLMITKVFKWLAKFKFMIGKECWLFLVICNVKSSSTWLSTSWWPVANKRLHVQAHSYTSQTSNLGQSWHSRNQSCWSFF